MNFQVLIKKCVKFEDLEIKKTQESQETQETQESQESEDLKDLDLQNLIKFNKHLFKHFFNSSLYLAVYILSERNEEPSKDRLKSLTSEILNEKV